MERTASILSVIALLAALFAYSVSHWAFPPVGFEGMIFFSGMSFFLASITASIAALICAYLLLRKRSTRKWPLLCSAIAGIALFVTVRFP
jgi:hypothetical protein